MKPLDILLRFDEFLHEEGLRLEAIVIGGAALALLGVISRPTQDVDILHPALPAEILDAAHTFARQTRSSGEALGDEWLNNGPASLAESLPNGWLDRTTEVFRGRAITLRSLGRTDLLRSKLFALCDRGIDLQDCVALAPTSEELHGIQPWLEQQDTNPEWPAHVRATLSDLQGRLSHGA